MASPIKSTKKASLESWRISIAPMVGQSTRQMRYLWRQLCSNCLLYTEMIPVNSLLHNDPRVYLDFSKLEKPLALQLASNSPTDLIKAVTLAQDWDFDEINLNVGCPSCKLTHSGVGAAMIKQPELTAECIAAMKSVAKVPITVKTRLGADDWDDDEKLHNFVSRLADVGVDRIIMHARKAWLKGLNPKQNRNAPPLQYERVAKLQKNFPDLPIIINGGIDNMTQLDEILTEFGSVMIGRLAYRDPLILKTIAKIYWGEDDKNVHLSEIINRQLTYASKRWQEEGEAFRRSGIHLLNICKGEVGARSYRRHLSSMLQNNQPPTFAQLSEFIPN